MNEYFGLTDENPHVRERAVYAIGGRLNRLDEPSPEAGDDVDRLLTMLADPSPGVRRAVVNSIDCERFPWACERLAESLVNDSDETARVLIAGRLGTPSLTAPPKALLQALHDASPKVRGAAASAIGWIGNPDAAPALMRSLSDESPFARLEACQALLKMSVSSEEVIRSLESLREDPIARKLEAAKELAGSSPVFRTLEDLIQMAKELLEDS